MIFYARDVDLKNIISKIWFKKVHKSIRVCVGQGLCYSWQRVDGSMGSVGVLIMDSERLGMCSWVKHQIPITENIRVDDILILMD